VYDHYGAQVRRQLEELRQQLSAARATIDGQQREALKGAARLRATEAERDRLKAHILDIDAHATPYGDLPDEPGYVGTYLLTAGALHRALGMVGHASASCEAEAELASLRQRYDDEHATAVTRAHETERVRTERDAFAAGIPLICCDERHEAKVRGLEELLVAGQKATVHWEEAYAREVRAHGITERALSAAEARIAAVRALHRPSMSGRDCEGCCDYSGDPLPWPCPTIAALDGPAEQPAGAQ
jgi:DNA repair exonuclease SbcCD ATPase subunit